MIVGLSPPTAISPAQISVIKGDDIGRESAGVQSVTVQRVLNRCHQLSLVYTLVFLLVFNSRYGYKRHRAVTKRV